MIMRQFLPAGISTFKDFLATCREAPHTPVPRQLLEDESLTGAVNPPVTVEQRRFATRRDAAEYLRDRLAPLSEQAVSVNAGLWTWLSLFFFDEVCPSSSAGRRVKNDYHYIFEPKNPRHFYRHLLFIAWRAIKLASTHSHLFLNCSVSILDKFTTEVMNRLYLTRIPCIFEVLDRLYWDRKLGRVRVGVTDFRNVKPGDLVHRFPIRMRQLEKTYDLFSLKADQLIGLLGPEFQFDSAP